MPRPVRPDADRLRLFVQIAEDALASPGLRSNFTLHMRFRQGMIETYFDEPDLRSKRDLLVVLRKLDQPSHDAFLPKIFETLDRVGVVDDWNLGLAQAKAAYDKGNEVGNIRVQIPNEPHCDNPTWILPRRAWELWLDGEVIHDDLAKQQEWESLDIGQGPVRQMAWDYMGMLLTQAAYLRRMIRLGIANPIDLPPPSAEFEAAAAKAADRPE
ncbi:MAG: hypothetical protein ABSE70_10395 [Candidatus Limnocylindrales bacterium]